MLSFLGWLAQQDMEDSGTGVSSRNPPDFFSAHTAVADILVGSYDCAEGRMHLHFSATVCVKNKEFAI